MDGVFITGLLAGAFVMLFLLKPFLKWFDRMAEKHGWNQGGY